MMFASSRKAAWTIVSDEMSPETKRWAMARDVVERRPTVSRTRFTQI
jgi:hypothetical protein